MKSCLDTQASLHLPNTPGGNRGMVQVLPTWASFTPLSRIPPVGTGLMPAL
jgi:hypothetical protein